jgi:sulfide dehydrogenase cytochrome subunit
MQKKLLGLKLAIALGAFATSFANAGGASTEMLANTCVGCHGAAGASNGPAIPSIAGLSSTYFVDVMKEYAKDERASTIMGRIARGYSDEELTQMGEYFAKQKVVGAKQEFDAAKAKEGAKLHDKYCEKCHTEGGSVGDDDAGILSGQWKHYIKYSLDDFHGGTRNVPKKMKKKLKKMLKKDKDAESKLLEYYASQQ